MVHRFNFKKIFQFLKTDWEVLQSAQNILMDSKVFCGDMGMGKDNYEGQTEEKSQCSIVLILLDLGCSHTH